MRQAKLEEVAVHRSLCVLLLAGVLMGESVFARAQDIQPGQWELNLQTNAGGAIQTQVIQQCLKDSDARDPGRLLMGSSGGALGCQLADQRRSAGHLDFSVSCSAGPGIGGRGSVDFTPTTVQGSVSLEFKGEGASVVPGGFSSHLSGRRVGSC